MKKKIVARKIKKRMKYSINEKIKFLDLYSKSDNQEAILIENRNTKNEIQRWLKNEESIRKNKDKPWKYSSHSGPKSLKISNEDELINFIITNNLNEIPTYSNDLINIILKNNPLLIKKPKKFFYGWLYRFFKRHKILFIDKKQTEAGEEKVRYIKKNLLEKPKIFRIDRIKKKLSHKINSLEANLKLENYNFMNDICIKIFRAKFKKSKNYKYGSAKINYDYFAIHKIDMRLNIIINVLENNNLKISFLKRKYREIFDSLILLNKESDNINYIRNNNNLLIPCHMEIVYFFDFGNKIIFPKYYLSNLKYNYKESNKKSFLENLFNKRNNIYSNNINSFTFSKNILFKGNKNLKQNTTDFNVFPKNLSDFNLPQNFPQSSVKTVINELSESNLLGIETFHYNFKILEVESKNFSLEEFSLRDIIYSLKNDYFYKGKSKNSPTNNIQDNFKEQNLDRKRKVFLIKNFQNIKKKADQEEVRILNELFDDINFKENLEMEDGHLIKNFNDEDYFLSQFKEFNQNNKKYIQNKFLNFEEKIYPFTINENSFDKVYEITLTFLINFILNLNN